jgi:DNA-binding transcriptional MerR regulator
VWIAVARGDRRDFVIIDRAGDDHSLARRLGIKAAEVRSYMADLDPASLPSVEQAKQLQAERLAHLEHVSERQRPSVTAQLRQAAQKATGKANDARASDGGRQANTASQAPETAPTPQIKPLGKTAGEIRLALAGYAGRHRRCDAANSPRQGQACRRGHSGAVEKRGTEATAAPGRPGRQACPSPMADAEKAGSLTE